MDTVGRKTDFGEKTFGVADDPSGAKDCTTHGIEKLVLYFLDIKLDKILKALYFGEFIVMCLRDNLKYYHLPPIGTSRTSFHLISLCRLLWTKQDKLRQIRIYQAAFASTSFS